MLWFKITTDVVKRTVKIETSTVEIEERGVKLRLTVVDTPGYGDGMDNKGRSVLFRKKKVLLIKQGNPGFYEMGTYAPFVGPKYCYGNVKECKCNLFIPTVHKRAVGARFKGDCAFQVELEFRNVGF